ncbi:hypothetical protein Tco_0494924 [Tanacetum coccineum]
MQIAQPSMNMGQDKQMQMVGGNDGNQFRHSESESSECWKSEWAYCCSGIANQNPNGNGNVVATWAEGNANGIMQASTSGTQTNKGHVYDSDGSANVEQDGGIVEQHPETVEETHAYFESLYNNLVIEVEKVNTVNQKHDPLAVYDSEETLQLAQESSLKMKQLNKEIKLEIQKIVKDEIFPIVNQVDIRVQNFEIQFLKEAAKIVRDFKSLTKEADESLAKHKALEFEIELLLIAVVSQDIMSIVQNLTIVETFDLQTELEQNVKNANTTKFHTIKLIMTCNKRSNGCKLSWEISRAQTKIIIDTLQNKLHDTIYENAKLRAQLFDKVSEQKDITKGTSVNTDFANQSTDRKPSLQSLRNNFFVRQPNAFQSKRKNISKTRIPTKVVETNDFSNSVTSNSVPTPTESHVVKNDEVIALGMFRIDSHKTSKEEKFMPLNNVRASAYKALLRLEDHSLRAIQSMIESPLRLRVVAARINKLK